MKIKKKKVQKSVSWKRKLEFKDYSNCLRASQVENIINYLGKEKNWCRSY